jgi:uncharacterized membrane protein
MTTYKEPSEETSKRWRNDSNNWILGVFYYNKKDLRVFPPKKNDDMGSTINFANPKSILALLVALAFFGMVIFFILNKNLT